MPADSQIKNWLAFSLFLSLLILDRSLTLINFGFVYTDLDQTVLWNGAMDYSRGIFHEPFFYGQAYNYMLEAFLAVPLLWLEIPVYQALPIATSFLSLLPFFIFGLLLMRNGQPFWAILSLCIPIILPIEYGFLTSISRGFVQAHLFIPLLILPLLGPSNRKNTIVLFVAAGASLIGNGSSVLIVVPITLWVFLHRFRSAHFYLCSLVVLPFFIVDQLAKDFYETHPERVLHRVGGLKLDTQTFMDNLSNSNLFEHLFPFESTWGILYPLAFVLLAVIAWRSNLKKEFAVIISMIFLIAITFAIPKVHEVYANAGVFFTSSRLYLFLPILFLISSFLIFRRLRIPQWAIVVLLAVSGLTILTKGLKIQGKVDELVATTSFPIAKNQDLINRWNELNEVAMKHKVDLIIHENENGWHYVFDSYVYNPLGLNKPKTDSVISVTVNGDRRTWLYADAANCNSLLLNGFSLNEEFLNGKNYIDLGKNRTLIQLNGQSVAAFLHELN